MSPAVFGHGHLRLYLLYVLDERSMHGYEIIQALSDRFGGTYVPSAGTIYPRLAKLEAEGLVTKQSDGRKTVYAITESGRAELNDRRDELEGIESGIGDSVRRLADEVRSSVTEAMTTLRAELAVATRDATTAASAASSAVRDATTSLHSTITETRSDGRAQVQRAEVLLGEFRQDLRTDLRTAVARGSDIRAAVDELESRRSRLRADLGSQLN
jgi:DNA-binding PadR family transcriptional regulator